MSYEFELDIEYPDPTWWRRFNEDIKHNWDISVAYYFSKLQDKLKPYRATYANGVIYFEYEENATLFMLRWL